ALTLLESMKQVINAVIDDLPPENQEDIEGDNLPAGRVQQNDQLVAAVASAEVLQPGNVDEARDLNDLQSNFACDRVAKWECPRDGCSSCLCRAHGKQYLDQAQNNPQRVYVNPRSGDRNNVQRNLDPFPDVGDDSDVDLDPLQKIIDLQAEDSDSSSDSQPDDLLVDVGLLSDDGASSDDDDNDGLNLPATDAADTPVMLDASSDRVQGHILLNKHF
ncbi:hypothetical protein FOZ63_003053, partial [Perkinsus olseni]